MEHKKFDDDNRVITTLAVCFITLAVIICVAVIIVSFNRGTQVESRVSDFGTAYRYVEVHSDNKTVWKFRGTLNVMVDGNTTIIRTKTGKEHIFVNADVLIKQIDRQASDSDSDEIQEQESTTSKQESTTSKSESSTSKVYEASNKSPVIDGVRNAESSVSSSSTVSS